MGYDKSTKKNIEEVEIKVFQKNETKMGETRLRTVCWVVDGKPTAPMFEKRAFVLREYKGVQQLQMSKAKGFTADEVVFVAANKEAIIESLNGYAAARKQAEVDTAQNKDYSFQDEEKIAEEMFS